MCNPADHRGGRRREPEGRSQQRDIEYPPRTAISHLMKRIKERIAPLEEFAAGVSMPPTLPLQRTFSCWLDKGRYIKRDSMFG